MKSSSITFSKIEKKIFHFARNSGFLSFSKFSFISKNKEINQIIDSFILSDYFLWTEKKTKGMVHFRNITESSDKSGLMDWNFHGLYNVDLISSKDYKRISFPSFIDFFKNAINKEIDNGDFNYQALVFLNDFKSKNYEAYILVIDDKSKIHQCSVFDFHYSGLLINSKSSEILLIEFGLD